MRRILWIWLYTLLLSIIVVFDQNIVIKRPDDQNVQPYYQPDDFSAIVPENGTWISNHVITFGWWYVEAAEKYFLQVDNKIDFGSPEIETETKDVVFASKDPLPDGTYYWRVKAYQWLWTGVATFTIFTVSSTSEDKDLEVPHYRQHKDTKMLCLDCCDQTGEHAWNDKHKVGSCKHDDSYCAVACIAMITRFYKGFLNQDRIAYKEHGGGVGPEFDLGHGYGIRYDRLKDILSWALSGAKIDTPEYLLSFSDVMKYINAGRPIIRASEGLRRGRGHTTIIDGYTKTGQMVHVIDPLTDTENIVRYASIYYNTIGVWIPRASAKGLIQERSVWDDSDRDGIVDFDETVRFKIGSVSLNPKNPDSDGDGYKDIEEVAYYTFASSKHSHDKLKYKPDPNRNGIPMELDSTEPYTVTIAAYCYNEGIDPEVYITKDGTRTLFQTPHAFGGPTKPSYEWLVGEHTFAVPNTDPSNHSFIRWITGITTTTITVSSNGTYTAYYYSFFG